MVITRLSVAALTAAVAFGVASCTGAPDRSDEAESIRQRVAAMPGVADVSTSYNNGVLEGTRFELDVDMDGATDAQVGAVAAEIDALRGDDFDEFDQRIEIALGDGAVLGSGQALPADAGHVATLLRRLRADVRAATVTWNGGPPGSSVDIQDAEATDRVVDAVLRVFADRPPDRIEVSAANRVDEAYWDVRTTLTPADKQRIDGELATAAPVDPGHVTVADGRITQLTFGVPDPATAYRDIVATIRAIGAGPARPVGITWVWHGLDVRDDEPRWAGSAQIGSCDYIDGDRTKSEPLVPDALALQQRIRDEFDSCPT